MSPSPKQILRGKIIVTGWLWLYTWRAARSCLHAHCLASTARCRRALPGHSTPAAHASRKYSQPAPTCPWPAELNLMSVGGMKYVELGKFDCEAASHWYILQNILNVAQGLYLAMWAFKEHNES